MQERGVRKSLLIGGGVGWCCVRGGGGGRSRQCGSWGMAEFVGQAWTGDRHLVELLLGGGWSHSRAKFGDDLSRLLTKRSHICLCLANSTLTSVLLGHAVERANPCYVNLEGCYVNLVDLKNVSWNCCRSSWTRRSRLRRLPRMRKRKRRKIKRRQSLSRWARGCASMPAKAAAEGALLSFIGC